MDQSSFEIPSNDPRLQARYDSLRRSGVEHDEAFVRTAWAASRWPLKPYEDGDTISFRTFALTEGVKVSENFGQQVAYWRMRREGQSHKMAELLATKSFPGMNGTDKSFNRGRANGNQFANCPALGNYYQAIADRAGVSTNGRYYCHGLGRFPGDPRAWVADTHDVRRIAQERNLNIDGIINIQGTPVEPKPDVPLAADIWHKRTQAILAEHPDMRFGDAREKAFAAATGADRPPDDIDVPVKSGVPLAEALKANLAGLEPPAMEE